MKLDHIYTKKHVTVGIISLAVISFIAIVVLVVGVTLINSDNGIDEPTTTTTLPVLSDLSISGTTLTIELADTDELRRQGLSNRESLDEDTGLLFTFESTDLHGIWMKDMNFPIDILWLDDSKSVIHIEENVDPSTYPEVFLPSSPARYVLELNAGKVDSLGIEAGDLAQF